MCYDDSVEHEGKGHTHHPTAPLAPLREDTAKDTEPRQCPLFDARRAGQAARYYPGRITMRGERSPAFAPKKSKINLPFRYAQRERRQEWNRI
jgi:hypothetical protein